MIESVEKLLILQERDLRIGHVEGELSGIGPQEQTLRAAAATAQAEVDQAKGRLRQIETSRAALELEVKAKKELIVRVPASSSFSPGRMRSIGPWPIKSSFAKRPFSRPKTRRLS